jgi:hypothetical protein
MKKQTVKKKKTATNKGIDKKNKKVAQTNTFPDFRIKPKLEINPDEDITTGKYRGVKVSIYNQANKDLKAKCDKFKEIYEGAFLGKSDKNNAILLLENKKKYVTKKLESLEKLRNPGVTGITVSGNDINLIINLIINEGYYNLQYDVYTGLLINLNHWQERIRAITGDKQAKPNIKNILDGLVDKHFVNYKPPKVNKNGDVIIHEEYWIVRGKTQQVKRYIIAIYRLDFAKDFMVAHLHDHAGKKIKKTHIK